MENIVKLKISISNLKPGMTVLYNNNFITVSKKDISYCSFMGYSFRGDASKKTITQILFKVQTNKGLTLR